MADFSYEDFLSWNDPNQGDPWNSPMPADTPGWEDFTGWGDPTGPGTGDYEQPGTSFWGGLGNLLLGAGGTAAGALGGGGGTGGGGLLGPLLSSLGSIGGGAIGSNAANEAARLQSQALNRGIDLQTAQWLQQQQNLAPYLQAGQGGLAQLQQLAGREQPGLPAASTQVQRQWYDYGIPSATPGWQPQNYQGPQGPNAADYRWTPGQGPQAADYRYTPGQTPDAAGYRWTPGQAPSAAQYRYTPGAVPTLSGQELLANDPGVAFRMAEGRKALEASAAARGGLLSGPTLAALQRQGQELGSQEYGQAWNRASQQAQLREQWGQAASTMGFGQSAEEARLREGWAQQASQQGFGQAEAAARLREQVNQIASQQGWTQAQAEATFREAMAQQASQQGFGQALAGQQNQFTQGLDTSKWNTLQQQQWAQEQYKNMLTNNQLMYGRDVAENQTNYEREQARYRQQLAQFMLPYEQQSTLASLGGQAVGMYGQQGQNATNAIANLLGQSGTASAMGTLGSAGQWNTALAGGVGGVQNILRGLNA